ncbi:MAG TPA: DUF3592 domain-containing protein [Candidatus Acidoferrales bacterium]|jgi:hypothetical protein|nr:DUF3592 domain-containing protein [Candidatus Acidoferrales bacterium]
MKIFPFIMLSVAFAFFGWLVFVIGLSGLFKQHDAESFPHVQGEVLSSQVMTTTGSKGRINYHPSIRYRYTVDGQEYTGWHYRYDGHPTDYDSARSIMSAHPVGSAIDVYYRPQSPEDSLLSPGVDTSDVGLFFFMAGLMVFLLWPIARAGRDADWPWTGPVVAGRAKVITEMMTVRVRLPRFQPLSVGLITTAILCVVSAGLSLFAFPSISPWVVWECSLVVVLLGGGGVYAWQFLNLRSGRQDLVIDEGARTVQFPITYDRREQTPVPFSQIRSVLLNRVRHQTKSGVYYTYLVVLDMTDNSEQKLIDLKQARAESLASWLREKLGLPATGSVSDDENLY